MATSVLAGDIGGTNTRLAVFALDDGGRPLAPALFQRVYPSASSAALEEIAVAFLAAASSELGASAKVDHACIGVAGPIENNICRATNLPWVVDGRALSQRLAIGRVVLVNDLTAAAIGVTAVAPSQLAALGGGSPVARGPIAVLGPGTGLGQAFLIWSSSANRYQVVPSEGGHVELAARTPLEQGLVQFLTVKYGRVSCERVLSGRGLADVFGFLTTEPAFRRIVRPETTAVLANPGPGGAAAAITERGLAGTDPTCRMALALFCAVLGAVAGDLALTLLTTGGVFIVGGIAPRIVEFLQQSGFREAFDRKGRLHTLVERMPAYVVMDPHVGLLGAATIAGEMARE